MTGTDDKVFGLDHQFNVLTLDPRSLDVLSKFQGPKNATCIASNGKGEIWVGDKQGVIHVLKQDSGEEITQLKKHTKGVNEISVSPCGTKIASGDAYRYIYVWDVETKDVFATLGEHKDVIKCLSWSHDGSRLLSVTHDLAYGVTQMENKQMVQKKQAHGSKGVNFICESLDGSKLFTAGDDCAIRIWPQ